MASVNWVSFIYAQSRRRHFAHHWHSAHADLRVLADTPNRKRPV